MLPHKSCGIEQALLLLFLLLWGGRQRGVRAADVPQELGSGESPSPRWWRPEQHLEGGPLMVVGHRVAEGGPEPFNPITVGIVGWGCRRGRGAPLLPLTSVRSSLERRGVWMPRLSRMHQRHAAARLGACHRPAQLVTEGLSGPLVGQGKVQPAVAPVEQAEAHLLGVLAGGLHQALAPPPAAAPDPRQGGMQGDMHLILEVHIGLGQQGEQPTAGAGSSGVSSPGGRIGEQSGQRWRRRQSRSRKEDLHP